MPWSLERNTRVTVAKQPSNGYTCSNSSATGTVAQANVVDATVVCLSVDPLGARTVALSLPTDAIYLVPNPQVHHLYANTLRLTASPASGASSPPVDFGKSLAASLTVPKKAPFRYLVDGKIVVVDRSPERRRVSYAGSAVRVDTMAADLVTVADSRLLHTFTSRPLSGKIRDASVELAHYVYPLLTRASLTKTGSLWSNGAEYVSYKTRTMNDTYRVGDCGPETTGATPTPCKSGATLETFLPSRGISTASGTIKTVGGVRVWTFNASIGAAVLEPGDTTPTFTAIFELNGNVYVAGLVKAGSDINFPFSLPSVGSGIAETDLLFNQSAIDSIQSALTF